MADTYHHGNLREALIEAGIKMINESGEGSLSLRRVANACEVSHSAPYAHFTDKESMVSAMKEYVNKQLTERIEQAVDTNIEHGADAAIVGMGCAYVEFFIEHPDYYAFLFSRKSLQIHFDYDVEDGTDYSPFRLLKELSITAGEEHGQTKEQIEFEIIRRWSIVHGLAGIACMDGITYSRNWKEIISTVIQY